MRTGFFILGIAFLGMSFMAGCGSKENVITLDIQNPKDQSIESVEDIYNHLVFIDVSATKHLESCSTRVFLADDPEVEVAFDILTPHVNSLLYSVQVNFSDEEGPYPSGTKFTMEVTACGNEECVFSAKKRSTFTIEY